MSAQPNPLQQARIDLAAALRWASRLGFSEFICNHFSLTAPGVRGRFLTNPHGLHWSEIVPSDTVLVDAQGRLIAGRHAVDPAGFFIHSCIYRARPKVTCILHAHMPYATSIALLHTGRLEPVSHNAVRFFGRVAYDDEYDGLVLDHAEGDRLCAVLGDHDVLFLAHHGVIVCGTSVANAFDDLYHLERAAMLQVLAQSTGKPLRRIPHMAAMAMANQITGDRRPSALHFAALKRVLERDEPGWSTK